MSDANVVFEPEPIQTWKRRNWNPEIHKGFDPRRRAEIETNRDLEKSIQQLLCDFHDKAELAERDCPDKHDYARYLLQGQKRMLGMMAKVALSNEALQKSNDVTQRQVKVLTFVATILAFIATVFGCFQAFAAVKYLREPQAVNAEAKSY